MDGSLTIIHLKMYASMVVEQAVEPPMGKTGEPGSDSPTAVGGAGASPDVPKTPDKIGAGGNGGHGGGGGGGAGGLFASAEAYGRQNYRPVSGSRRTADRRGKGLLVQMAGRAV